MSTAPAISIVLIFKDEECFLPEAIASVLAQSTDDWELLLVDDGSSDGSTELARESERQHPDRIRYLEHREHANLGMSAARNLGLRHARGQYISFLDADDVWLPRKLEQQRAILEANPAVAMVCGRAQWWFGWTGHAADVQRDFVQDLHVPLDTIVQPPLLLCSFLEDEYASICDLLVRRTAIDGVGAYETEFQGLYEDQVFHAKLCTKYPVFVARQTWYRYRQHPDSCVAQTEAADRKRSARRRFLEWLEGYIAANGLTDVRLQEVLQRQLRPFHHPRLATFLHGLYIFRKTTENVLLWAARVVLPDSVRYALARFWYTGGWPPVGWVRMGQLRRLSPISSSSGFDRGRPIDRYYIESFLCRNAEDIRGHVLEVADNSYTWRFGGERVRASDVLHAPSGDPGPDVTILDDLTRGDNIPSDAFDCVILTQTLLLVYDVRAAIQTVYRILKPGGIVLVTVPGITPIIREAADTWGQYWSFTSESARNLFVEVFSSTEVTVETHGNVLAASAFLYGLATEDLRCGELDHHDPDYEVIITLRARKSAG